MSSPDAGPSRPRQSSFSSLTGDNRRKSRTSNERVGVIETEYASTAMSARRLSGSSDMPGRGSGLIDDNDDEDDLPGYTHPSMGVSRNEGLGDTGDHRQSAEKVSREGAEPLLGGGAGGLGMGSTSYGDRRNASVGSGMDMEGSRRGEAASVSSYSVAQRKARWWKETIITGCFVASWYGFATLLSLYNKWMFSEQYYNFPFPLFVTGCHMVVQFVLALFIRLVWAARFRPPERPTRRDYAVKIFPTAASTAGDIGLSNLSLRTITLSLYTMCKSSALIFVLLFAFLFRLESFSLRLVGVISLISLGVFLMVFDTTSVDVPGIIMVFSASALSGLRWALTETLMKKRKMGLSNPFATIFWLAPMMAAILVPVSLGVEGWGNVFGSGHWEGGKAVFTSLVIIFPGTLAFAMVASEYFIIDRAGILPLSIAGVFKEVSTISISAWVFGDQLTRLNVVGVVVAVSGIALFAFHKYQKSVSEPDEHPHGHGHSHGHNHSSSHLATQYSLTASADPDPDPTTPRRSDDLNPNDTLEMRSTPLTTHSTTRGMGHTYPPSSESDEAEGKPGDRERVDRLRDEFEGWNDDWREGSEESESDDGRERGRGLGLGLGEAGEDEVIKRREERLGLGGGGGGGGGRGGWKEWWDREM